MLFDQKAFLKLCPSSDVPFFQYLFDTQIFTAFIEQRSFAHSESSALAFFDECTEKVRRRGCEGVELRLPCSLCVRV